VDWVHLAQHSDQFMVLVNAVMNVPAPLNV
jgi:hypothetical protein